MAHSSFRRASVIILIPLVVGTVGVLYAASPRLRREFADERRTEPVAALGVHRESDSEYMTQPGASRGDRFRAPLAPAGGENRSPLGPATDGVAWLKANENPSGSWGTVYEFVDTCTVIETLAAIEPGCEEVGAGAAWLSGHAASNYEYLARQIVALAGAPHYESFAAGLADGLIAARNPAASDPSFPNWPEGGWGVAGGYETDCFTTAVALLALEAAGYNGGLSVSDVSLPAGLYNVHEWDIPQDATKVNLYVTVTGTTVHLRMAEGEPPLSGMGFSLSPGTWWVAYPDSGLPFTPGHNYIVLQNIGGTGGSYTLTAAYETPEFDTLTLAEPFDYLREAQNADGGWGLQRGRETEFYTTLHVLLALLKYSNYDFTTEISDGIGYVQSHQLGDGSFGYDGIPVSYVTSLATLALIRSEGYPFSAPTEDAISAVLTMQAADGSWDQEPYHTALGALALWDTNQRPTARAGDDLQFVDNDLNGFEDVTLDGSGSSDVDGSIVSYVWTDAGQVIGTGPSPTVTLALGTHEITLTVTDDGGKRGTDTLTVIVSLPRQVFFEEKMDSDPGWDVNGLWAWGVPQGNDGWHGGVPPNGPDPTSGCTGPNVYGYNLDGAYEDNLPATYLTTPAIDCSRYAGVQLSFCRWLCVEDSQYDHASLEVSNDAYNWTTVFEHDGPTLIDHVWSTQEYDISAVADGQPTVFLRWVMGPTDHTWNYGGWNIDDVVLTGFPVVAPGPAIVSSVPADGYIDPRDPACGIQTFTVTFDRNVRNADGSPLSTEAFTLSSTSGGAPPVVQSIDASGNPTVLVTLSGPIEAQHWSTLTATVANMGGVVGGGEIDVGFLPCDVNQSGNVNISDATAFVNEFNGLQRVELIDTNCSGNVNVSDATRFRVLFIGGWSGKSLPQRP